MSDLECLLAVGIGVLTILAVGFTIAGKLIFGCTSLLGWHRWGPWRETITGDIIRARTCQRCQLTERQDTNYRYVSGSKSGPPNTDSDADWWKKHDRN